MNKNLTFVILLSIAALSLAGTAAYFSIFGLTKLFASAGLGITILAAALEFSKLVTVSYVYRYWKNIKPILRAFYVFAVVFIMFLTSVGIYGFLTGAYQQSANKLESRDSQIKIVESKKSLFKVQLDMINKSIESSNNRINTLSGLRTQQEKRLDDLYTKKNNSIAKSAESHITGSDNQINMINSDITLKMKQASVYNDSISYYEQKIINLKSSDATNEIGPYKFVAKLTGIPIDNLVNIVALLIICVFDPLAITLLIGINQLTEKKEDDEVEEDEEVEEVEKEKYNKIVIDVINYIINNPKSFDINTNIVEPIVEPIDYMDEIYNEIREEWYNEELEYHFDKLNNTELDEEPLVEELEEFMTLFDNNNNNDDDLITVIKRDDSITEYYYENNKKKKPLN